MTIIQDIVAALLSTTTVLDQIASEISTKLSSSDSRLTSIVWWLSIWTLRYEDDSTRYTDLWIWTAVRIWQDSRGDAVLQKLCSRLGSYLLVSVVICGLLLAALSHVAFRQARRHTPVHGWEAIQAQQVLIHRCQTSHTRRSPATHGFSYPYLQVSIPVPTNVQDSRVLSLTGSKWSLFSLRPNDYLERHAAGRTLESRLSSYLESQNIPRADWKYAYLVTAPAFLGYSFNPVSFWYIYDARDHLSMMILEVNNTFDERRIYLLSDNILQKHATETKSNFSMKWAKDFHVSPFNSRKGDYSLKANDPFTRHQCSPPGIRNMITLVSSKGDVKLVASIQSAHSPVELENMSVKQLIDLILYWAWLGFFTSPRILKEAFTLYFRRKLHVWLRPEVKATSIGRKPTRTESVIADAFQRYLEAMVERCHFNVQLSYRGGIDQETCMVSKSAVQTSQSCQIAVRSPEFFSRLVSYGTVMEALCAETTDAAENDTVVAISDVHVLETIFREEAAKSNCSIQGAHGTLEALRWRVLAATRFYSSRFATMSSATPNSAYAPKLSALDVHSALHGQKPWQYRRLVTRLHLAKIFAFGATGVVDMLDLSMRTLLILMAGRSPVLSSIVHMWAFMKG